MGSAPPSQNFDSAVDSVARAFSAFSTALQEGTNTVGDVFVSSIYPLIERTTRFFGTAVAPIADIPFIKFATGLPGLSWLLAALGQVNDDKVRREVAELRVKFPLDTNEKLAQRIVSQTTLQGAQVGLLTNLIPPFAVLLFALDLGAIAALQAEMIYKIAAIYGFSTDDVERRGEVLAIWAVFTGSSGTLKSGLSFLELLPGLGTAIGISSDAAIIYGVGCLACRYYEVKLGRQLKVQGT